MAYLSRTVDENEINNVILRLVSKEFFTPPQKITLDAPDPENRIIEIA